jgi:hypothetical protein
MANDARSDTETENEIIAAQDQALKPNIMQQNTEIRNTENVDFVKNMMRQ